MSDAVDKVLLERQVTHGKFKDHAKLSQELKTTVWGHTNDLSLVQTEALEMIMHKIARILNGKSANKDHWIDIMGYAQLAINELDGIDV